MEELRVLFGYLCRESPRVPIAPLSMRPVCNLATAGLKSQSDTAHVTRTRIQFAVF